MGYTCSIEEAMADQDLSSDSACPCDRFDIIRCRADATLITSNDNWRWGGQNPLFGAYNRQWMMDMAKFYSSSEGPHPVPPMNQTEICALDQAFTAAMAAGAAGAPNGAYNFRNAYNQVVNYIRNGDYSFDFADKVEGIIHAAQMDGRHDELNWLMDTVTELSGGYQWDWNGHAADGVGHGSPQMTELLKLMDGMRNGGNWEVLGFPYGVDFDSTLALTEQNNGLGGIWSGFDMVAHDAWITESLNQDIMGADWEWQNTGDNSLYHAIYDQWWGWRPTAPPGPTNPTTTIGWGGVGEELSPADLPHATCLMDQQLKIIEEFFVSQGFSFDEVTVIKDSVKLVLETSAIGSADNPNNVNWFQGSLEDINADIEQAIASLADPAANDPAFGDWVLWFSSQPQFATLLTQLQLMADIGDPENKDAVDKDQFKAIDWYSIIPVGTTVETYDPNTVYQNAKAQILAVGGVTPAGLNDEIDRTYFELTNIAPNEFPATAAPGTTSAPTPACGPNEHWIECDYCTERDCKNGMTCAKKSMSICLIENQCVCDPGYARYTGGLYLLLY